MKTFALLASLAFGLTATPALADLSSTPGANLTPGPHFVPSSIFPKSYLTVFDDMTSAEKARFDYLSKTGDDAAVFSYLGERAQDGKVWAMTQLGVLYAESSESRDDALRSVNWFAQAAKAGHAPSALLMAYAYTSGKVLRPDAEKARAWLALAEKSGDYRIKEDAAKVRASLTTAN